MGPPDVSRLILRLGCFLPLAGALILADWVGLDPAVQGRVERPFQAAADAMRAGKNVVCSDMRDLKAAYLERLPERRDILIFGDSRALQIREEWFQPRTMWNAAVAGGDLDDMVALFEVSVETGKTPRMVVLGLNPVLTIIGGKPNAAPVLEAYWGRALLRYRIFPPRLWTSLSSAEALRSDLQLLRQPPVWSIADEPVRNTYRVRPDGTADWEATVAHRTPDEVEADVIPRMRRLNDSYQRWRTSSDPDSVDLRILRAFLDDLRARNVEVKVLLAPVHPAAYDYSFRLGGYHEEWMRREMASRGIPVVGSYSPAVVGAGRADFFDDVHPHPDVVRRLLNEAGIIGEAR